jgi:sugar diacid utilization regulator
VLLLVPHTARATTLQALAERASLLVAHADAAPVGDGLGDRVRHAAQLLEAARLSGRTRGVVGPSDLVLEQFVATNDRAARVLRERVLAPLSEHDPDGVFAATLRTYLACGSVPETARDHVCHPNTVAYRLKRIEEITGLDARIPRDATVLVMAMIVERSLP